MPEPMPPPLPPQDNGTSTSRSLLAGVFWVAFIVAAYMLMKPLIVSFCGDLIDRDAFNRARKTVAYRPHYLARVMKKAGPKVPSFVRGIQYVAPDRLREIMPWFRSVAELPSMVTVNHDLSPQAPLHGGMPSMIFVLPSAFEPERVGSEIEFLLGLLDHEVGHARHAFDGFNHPIVTSELLLSLPPQTAEWLYNTIGEMLAYQKELDEARRYQLRERYFQMAYGQYLRYYVRLWDDHHPLGERLRDDLKKMLFMPWMRLQENIFDADKRQIAWQGETYALPPSVLSKCSPNKPSQNPETFFQTPKH